MVYRVYVEKKAALANETRALLEDLRAFLGIESLTGLRLFNRYDLEGISRELFDYTVKTVLSEPQLDIVTDALPQGDAVFAVEYLPGQYDQRADSAAQCVQILSQGERPLVRTARVYGGAQAVLTPAAQKQAERLTELGFGDLPVCMAKTQYSLSDDPTLLGAPKDFAVTVRSLKVSAGAGFIVALTGEIMTMPGLPKVPAAEKIDMDENGRIAGLF